MIIGVILSSGPCGAGALIPISDPNRRQLIWHVVLRCGQSLRGIRFGLPQCSAPLESILFALIGVAILLISVIGAGWASPAPCWRSGAAPATRGVGADTGRRGKLSISPGEQMGINLHRQRPVANSSSSPRTVLRSLSLAASAGRRFAIIALATVAIPTIVLVHWWLNGWSSG
jgi:hypothetical protein